MSSDRLKIVHIITSLRIGGAERLVADMLPRLRDRGHQVELVVFDGTRTPFYEQLERQNIKIHSLGFGAAQMWNPMHLFRLKRYLDRGRFDIVHTHNTPCQLLAALAAGKNAPILVTTEHNTFNRRRNWQWWAGIDRRMYGKYSHIICVGEQTRCNLLRRLGEGFDAERISVVHNGIDLKRYAEATAEASLRERADEGCHIVAMVAAFREQKDQPTLIRAMQLLPESYRLWLAGDGVTREECERLAGELNVADRVRFMGFRADAAAVMASSDVVVLSSHYEGMSLASIEGMASGKPFIASDVEGLRDVAEGAGLLFPHEDHKSLAGLVRKVCEDEVFGSEVAARCRERAVRYDIEDTVSGCEGIYISLEMKRQKQ